MSVADLADRLSTPAPARRWLPCPGTSPLGAALWVTAAYAVLLGAWLALSDSAVLTLAGTKEALARLQAWKGAGWLVASSGLLFLLALTLANRVAREARAVRALDARFRAFAEMAPMSLFEARADGRLAFLSVDQGAAGVDPARAGGLGWQASILPEDLEAHLAAWDTFAGADGPALFERQVRVLRDGQVRWALVRVRRMAEPDRFVGVAVDITRWKQAEAAAEANALTAKALDNARRQFLDTAGQGMRAPLDTVIGFAEVLRGGVAEHPGTVRAFARDIATAGRELLGMLEDAQACARVEAAAADGALPEAIEPDAEVARAIRRLSARHQGRKLAWDHAPAPGALLLADLPAFRQLLHLLLDDAARRTRPGGRVGVALAEAGGVLELSVSDGGPGWPGGPTPEEGDWGFGPTLAGRLAKLVGGSLHRSVRPGGGGLAVLRLPVLPEPAGGGPGLLPHRTRVALAAFRAEPRDLDPLLRAACLDMAEATGADRAGIWFLGLDGRTRTCECRLDRAGGTFDAGPGAGDPVGNILERPVLAGDQPVALLCCERADGPWEPAHANYLGQVALLLGMALRARLAALSGDRSA